MMFKSIIFLGVAFGHGINDSALQKRKNTCHDANDKIGKYCQFFTEDAWQSAVNLYCSQFEFGLPVPEGNSYGLKIDDQPDGAGGQQIFWGNFRVDAKGTQTITEKDCMDDMSLIFASCGGYGGWVNTDFGTVFGECIRK